MAGFTLRRVVRASQQRTFEVMSDLRACPNCGNDAARPELASHDGHRRSWVVVCTACRMRVPDVPADLGFEESMALWNRAPATR